MPALSVSPPFPIFTDTDGQPLENGYVWIGTVNLNPINNPIAVFWDAALTQPAGQPIRTLNGYPSNAGTPTRLYANSDYSIQVQNKNGSVVYAAPAAGERFSGVVVKVDATDVTFLQAGTGAVTRTAQAKMRETISVSDYTSLQAAITAAKTTGNPTRIILNGDISTSTTIVVDAPNIFIDGAGSDSSHDLGTQGAGARARIIWTGVAGGTVMRFASPSGAGLQACSGGGIQNVYFGCGGSAEIGLQVLSWRRGTFRNLHFDNPTTVALDVGVVATLGEARDTQYNDFRQISSRHLEVSGGLGGLLRLGGDATANTSLNVFEQLDCQFSNGTAYLFNNSDNNMLSRLRAFRAGGTGSAIVFNGSNVSAAEAARSNIVIHMTTNGALPIIHRGTTSFTHPSIDNSVLLMDFDNGYQPPTLETGATGWWSDTRGINAQQMLLGASVGDDITSVTAAKARRGLSSVHIVNSSQSHMALSDAANSNAWGISLDGSGNLRFTRSAGSGRYGFTLAAITDAADDTAASAAGVGVGSVYRTGSTLKVRVT